MSQSLDIVIRTKHELEGAQRAVDNLEREIGAAKALGNEFADMERKRDAAQAAIANAVASQPAKPQATEMFTADDSRAAKGMIPGLENELQRLRLFGEDTSKVEARLLRLRTIASANDIGQGGWIQNLRQVAADSIPGFAKLDATLTGIGVGTLGLVAAGAAGVAAAFKLAAASVREFAGAEREIAKLDAALAQTGQLTDANRERLQELADEMEDLTGVDDSAWTAVLAKLTQFGANKDNIRASTEAVKNLAGILGGDVQQAAMMVSKALQGGFEAFSRYGIKVDEAGSQSEKLDKLFQQLAQRGGGQLEAMNGTLIGQWGQVKNAIGDVTKAIGTQIASTGIIQGALEMAGNAASWWADALKSTIPAVKGLQNAIEPTVQGLYDGSDAAKKMAESTGRIGEEANRAADALSKVNDEIDKQRSREDRMDDLLQQRDLKQWELMKEQRRRRGAPVSELEDIGVKAAIEAKYAERKTSREVGAETKKLQNVEKAQAEDQRRMDQAAAELETARQRVAMAKRVEKFAGAVRGLDQNDERDKQEIERLKQEESSFAPSVPGVAGERVDNSKEIAQLEKQIAERAKQREVFQRRADAERSQGPTNLKPLAEEEAYQKQVEEKYKAETNDDRQKQRDQWATEADNIRKELHALKREIDIQRQIRGLNVAAGAEKYTADRRQKDVEDIMAGRPYSTPPTPQTAQVAAMANAASPGAGQEAKDLSAESARIRRSMDAGVQPYQQQPPPVVQPSAPAVPSQVPQAAIQPPSPPQDLSADASRVGQAMQDGVRTYKQSLDAIGGQSVAAVQKLGESMQGQLSAMTASINALAAKLNNFDSRVNGLRIP